MELNKNHVLAGLCIFFLVLVGISVFGKKDDAKAPAARAVQISAVTQTIEAPFLCNDGSHFVAAFSTDMESAQIVVDGVAIKQVTLTPSSSGRVYKDQHTTFTFRGEGVAITRADMPTPVTCSPPQDPNNAPMNFGD
jgi:hypothetical protein